VTVLVQRDGPVAIVTIDRPEVRNAVDGETASGGHRVGRDGLPPERVI
jgi:enoyl-CoA hydratase/carnithine racemase